MIPSLCLPCYNPPFHLNPRALLERVSDLRQGVAVRSAQGIMRGQDQVTAIEILVLDARWEAIGLLLPHRHPAPAATSASTIAPRWPTSSTRRHHLLLDELGR
jgi:hypothetical protein